MNTYRKNAVMAGVLYFLGTVFGVLGVVIGGEVLSSLISANRLPVWICWASLPPIRPGLPGVHFLPS